MAVLQKNDKDIEKNYSEITDLDELTKKLADECAKIARKKIIQDLFIKNLDELLEKEIEKYSVRFSELCNNNLNLLQVWFSKWKR